MGAVSMFVFGGNTTSFSFNDLWELRVDTHTWTKIAEADASMRPSGRVGHTLTAVGSRLLLLGGREYKTNHFDPLLHVFDVRTRAWTPVPVASAEAAGARESAGTVRTGHCTTVYGGRLIVFGGLNHTRQLLDDLTTVSLIN